MSDLKALAVPEGLEGERVDAAIARVLGLSRTRAAEIAASGAVRASPRGSARGSGWRSTCPRRSTARRR